MSHSECEGGQNICLTIPGDGQGGWGEYFISINGSDGLEGTGTRDFTRPVDGFSLGGEGGRYGGE